MSNIIDLSKAAELNEGEFRAQIDQLVERGTEGRFAVIDRTQGENLPADAIGRQRIVTFSGLKVADLGTLLSRARLLKLEGELKNQLDVIRELQNKLHLRNMSMEELFSCANEANEQQIVEEIERRGFYAGTGLKSVSEFQEAWNKGLENGRFYLLGELRHEHPELRDCKTLKEALQNKKAILKITRFESNRNFHVLPPEIGELTNLEELSLINSALVTLPREIGQLRNLRKLDLSFNRFKILPPVIWHLTELRVLNLPNNRFEELSPEVEKLQNLQRLDIANNLLKELPREIAKLKNLSNLRLFSNQLRDFPSEIWQMSELKLLHLGDNQFSALPPCICQMTKLQLLTLSYNPNLHGLPLEILDLPSSCTVLIDGCGLSEQVLTRLRAACNQPDYQGPHFSFSMAHLEMQSEEKPTQEILKSLFAALDEPYVELTQVLGPDVDQRALCSWVNRLSFLKDLQGTPETKNWIIRNIVNYLNLADQNKDFRVVFAATIQDAAATCGDRVALSILHLGIQHRLATIDLKDMKGLAEFLKRGVFAVSLLEEIARNKVPALRFFDEIEVYLAYPIMLKKVLDLPIDVEGMLYFGCAGVTEDDLNEAADSVKKQMEGEQFYQFLIDHEKWQKALDINYPEECEKLRDKRAEDAELEGADFEELNRKYKAGLLELSKRALTNEIIK